MSICHGDSGGPAISQSTGAVIGVVSRGGDCGEDFGHVYTSTSGFADLVDKAIHLAGAQAAQLEPEPPPQAGKAANPGAKGGSDGGCAVPSARLGRSPAGIAGVILALAAALVARRRRPSKA
jgi:secreted trypsin-like serine protease